jgi:thioredoxin-dependent peroxiredoxin
MIFLLGILAGCQHPAARQDSCPAKPPKEAAMTERKNAITMKGKPLTLVGFEPQVGQAAPDATLLANDLSEVKLSSYRGKIVVISVVPSLDTSVCDLQTRRFNEEASALGPNVVILTISMDLPFAQKRWCGAAGVDRVITLSDYRDASFGHAWGVMIKELRLLARSVFVVDPQGKIAYIQRVPELSQQPDYDSVLQAVRKLQ